MFLRPNRRSKDGKEHTYWSLVETVRTADGPRQRTLCYLGELNSSAQARWWKTVEVFNEQGEAEQLKLFPAQVEPPADDPPGSPRAGEPGTTGTHAPVRCLLVGSGTMATPGIGSIFRGVPGGAGGRCPVVARDRGAGD